MISKFELENFKSIKQASFNFKKINLFIGPNNSGKTSVLQALAFLLQEGLTSSAVEGRYVDLTNLTDFAFKKDPSTIFKFSISLSFTEEELQTLSNVIGDSSWSHFNFSHLTLKLGIPLKENLGYSYVTYLSSILFDAGDKAIIGLDGLQKGQKPFVSDEFEPGGEISSVSLKGFMPYSLGGLAEVVNRWPRIIELIEEHLSNFFWLKTPRSVGGLPKTITYELPGSVGLDGNLTLDVLARIRDMDEYMQAWDKIRAWISKFGLREEVVPRLKRGNEYSLHLRDRELDLKISIMDMGFGINQILPVITQCFYVPPREGIKREEAIIFIEQPEVHLHPAMQAQVADLFIDASKMGKQLIIETHSEHIPLRFQRRIAEGDITSQDVAIFYFNKDEKGTHVKEVELDEMGRYKEKEPFPGFFEVELNDSLKHTEAISKRLSGKPANEK